MKSFTFTPQSTKSKETHVFNSQSIALIKHFWMENGNLHVTIVTIEAKFYYIEFSGEEYPTYAKQFAEAEKFDLEWDEKHKDSIYIAPMNMRYEVMKNDAQSFLKMLSYAMG